MKYLIDYSVLMNSPEIVFDTNPKNNYFTSNYIHFYKTHVSGYGRYYTIPKGYHIYQALRSENKIQLTGNYRSPFNNYNEREATQSIAEIIEKSNDYIVVTDNFETITAVNLHNKKYISPELLKTQIKIDMESYNHIVNERKEFVQKEIDVVTKVRLSMFFLAFITILIIYFWEQSQKIFGVSIIVPISLMISLILFYLKKKYFKLYIYLELLFGLTLCFVIYNFYESTQLNLFKKILSIASGVFVLLRSFNNLDTLLIKKNPQNKFARLWHVIFDNIEEKTLHKK